MKQSSRLGTNFPGRARPNCSPISRWLANLATWSATLLPQGSPPIFGTAGCPPRTTMKFSSWPSAGKKLAKAQNQRPVKPKAFRVIFFIIFLFSFLPASKPLISVLCFLFSVFLFLILHRRCHQGFK